VRTRFIAWPLTAAATLTFTLTSTAAFAAEVIGQFPAGAGQPQVQAACGACHAVTVVTAARKSEPEWERTVAAMVTRGARVPDEDYDAIVDYLVRNFSAP
jgi:mono/diheme cytochrome c family protein